MVARYQPYSPETAEGTAFFKCVRAPFLAELVDSNGQTTDTMREFAARMEKEVGSEGPDAQRAWAESVINRCIARKHTLAYELSNHENYAYWPKHQSQPGLSDNQGFMNIILTVIKQGTNLSNNATGNASGNVGFGGGYQTSTHGSERFGVELADTGWMQKKYSEMQRQYLARLS
ncbi:MAG: hypothetical protein EB059_01820 [Alphaproteobacteria bacterium]|nr:hypothetical protein [Alphaproteobacteria bacterium]